MEQWRIIKEAGENIEEIYCLMISRIIQNIFAGIVLLIIEEQFAMVYDNWYYHCASRGNCIPASKFAYHKLMRFVYSTIFFYAVAFSF